MTIRIACIGTGNVTLQNHIPGLLLHPEAKIVAVCDANPDSLEKAASTFNISRKHTDYKEVIASDDVDAVVIATPNIIHRDIAVAAARAGKHVMSEKPLGMNLEEAVDMLNAVDDAKVVNMTAFTYRFVPAMRYMHHLIKKGSLGRLYHFRVNRLQDWVDRAVGWRQTRSLAGSGELGDMLSHRIDYGHFLVGPMSRVVAQMRRLLDKRKNADGTFQNSDVDDWVGMLGEFQNGTTGLFESTKMAAGRGFYLHSQDYVEVNGSDGSLIYLLSHPHEVQIGTTGGDLKTVQVPEEFLKIKGSPRDPHSGDPLQNFRYDQSFEFVQAIVEKRNASPDFFDGCLVQSVMDAIIESSETNQWVDVQSVPARKGVGVGS